MLEERKLQKAKITVMRNSKFALLQGVMMVGRTYINDFIPTACTNGRDESYGRAFVKQLSEPTLGAAACAGRAPTSEMAWNRPTVIAATAASRFFI